MADGAQVLGDGEPRIGAGAEGPARRLRCATGAAPRACGAGHGLRLVTLAAPGLQVCVLSDSPFE